jgi:hypothetical protein
LSSDESADPEVRRALERLRALIEARQETQGAQAGRPRRGSGRAPARRERRLGYVSRQLAGRFALEHRQVLEILSSLGIDPAEFFRRLYGPAEAPAAGPPPLELFVARLAALGFDAVGPRTAADALGPPPSPQSVDRRLRAAIELALGAGANAGGRPGSPGGSEEEPSE